MRVRQLQVAHGHPDRFARPGTGVVQEEQYRVIAEALPGAEVRGVEQRIHLMFFEITHAFVWRLLERDAADLIAPREVLGAAAADEAPERVERGQSLIASRDAAGASLFEMAEKLANAIRRHILDAQSVDGGLRRGGEEGDQ